MSSPAEKPPFALALPHVAGPLFVLDEATLRFGCESARRSPRLRIVLPLHRKPEAAVQRLLNFLQPGTYVRPHAHEQPEAVENVVVLRGAVRFFLFDNAAGGEVIARGTLKEGGAGMIDIEPGVWHAFYPLAPDTVILEVKRGPYSAELDKVFPAWAPPEGSPEAGAWMTRLLQTAGI